MKSRRLLASVTRDLLMNIFYSCIPPSWSTYVLVIYEARLNQDQTQRVIPISIIGHSQSPRSAGILSYCIQV